MAPAASANTTNEETEENSEVTVVVPSRLRMAPAASANIGNSPLNQSVPNVSGNIQNINSESYSKLIGSDVMMALEPEPLEPVTDGPTDGGGTHSLPGGSGIRSINIDITDKFKDTLKLDIDDAKLDNVPTLKSDDSDDSEGTTKTRESVMEEYGWSLDDDKTSIEAAEKIVNKQVGSNYEFDNSLKNAAVSALGTANESLQAAFDAIDAVVNYKRPTTPTGNGKRYMPAKDLTPELVEIAQEAIDKAIADAETAKKAAKDYEKTIKQKQTSTPNSSQGGNSEGDIRSKYTDSEYDYYENLFNQMLQDGYIGYDEDILNSKEALQFMLENGDWFISKPDSEGKYVNQSLSANSWIEPVTDKTDIAKAEAEYNAATLKINNKEKILDNELKKLDTEHSALNTEMDSVQQLIKNNSDKTFNLFS